MSIRFKGVKWLNGASIYEVNVRQYTPEGTLQAFEKHLPRIRKMGVDVLWFMPLTPISIKNRKGSLGSYYAASNYMDINPEFGSTEDFKQLVLAAHALGFKVIIDWVANHTGWDHIWTQHADWYLKDDQGNFTETHGWEDVIDLNYQNQDMQAAMIHAMKYWIGMFDIDGFRCDMAHLVPLSFWQKARTDLEQLKQLLWLGECDDDAYSDVFDITYGWRWMHDSEKLRYNEDLPAHIQHMTGTLQHYKSLPAGAEKLLFTGNHDENSWNGTAYEKYADLALPLAAFTFLYPAVPLIYGGQEIPNTKRLSFFDKDQLDWPASDPPALASFYESLISLHRHPAFGFNTVLHWLDTGPNSTILAYFVQATEGGNGKALVMLNLSQQQSQLFNLAGQLTEEALTGIYTHMDQRMHQQENQKIQSDQQWVLPPASFSVYYSKEG
jgi:glycosidase